MAEWTRKNRDTVNPQRNARAKSLRAGETWRESRNAYHREYMQDPGQKAKARERKRAYVEANRDKVNEQARRHAAAKRARDPEWNRLQILKRKGGAYTAEGAEYARVLLTDPCSYCGGPGGEVDHVTPIARGGDGSWLNLTSACRSCNGRKHKFTLLTYLARSQLSSGGGAGSLPGPSTRSLQEAPCD